MPSYRRFPLSVVLSLLGFFLLPLRGDAEDGRIARFSAYTPRPAETRGDTRVMASGNEVYIGAVACPAFLEGNCIEDDRKTLLPKKKVTCYCGSKS